MSALLIILVGLTVTLFSEKMLISTRCIHGFMPNLIKKSVRVSSPAVSCTRLSLALSHCAKLCQIACAELAWVAGDWIGRCTPAGPAELGIPTHVLTLIETKPSSLNDFLLLLASPNCSTLHRARPAYCCSLPRRSDAFTPFVCILCVQLAVVVVNINGCIIGIFRELDD